MHRQDPRIGTSLSTKFPSFGQALRNLRGERGLSARELSARIGVSQDVVRQWESDESIPSALQLKKLYGTFPRLKFFESVFAGQHAVRTPGDAAVASEEPPLDVPDQPALPSTFGDALRGARIAEGLDQDALGGLLDVTGQAVSAWEHDIANPILAHYDQLRLLFPTLASAPKPHAQNIEKPDGGKGAARDSSNRPSPSASYPDRTFDSVPTSSPPRSPALAIPDGAARIAAIGMVPPPSDLTRDEVDELGACYAQTLMHLRRSELVLQELRLKLASAEEEVQRATEQVTRADDKLKRAVAEATATAG
jgi:transcriptional regulator with XRE-family HTH domain